MEDEINMFVRLAVVSAFFLVPATFGQGNFRFLSIEDVLQMLKPTIELPKSAFCPEGAVIPIQATFAEGKIKDVRFYGKTNVGWLYKPDAESLKKQAEKYISTAQSTRGKDAPTIKTVIRVPCQTTKGASP